MSVRELKLSDIVHIVNYFVDADAAFLKGMGALKEKMPQKNEWIKLLQVDYEKPYSEKTFYYVIWMANGKPIGHTNINKIKYGEEAYMHLHLWRPEHRQRGQGLFFLKKSIPYFFKNFQLKNLYCEPYALNPAPNKTLPKLGFKFIKEYITTPGWINFEQSVRQYVLSVEAYNTSDMTQLSPNKWR